jgi:hypothetical protein
MGKKVTFPGHSGEPEPSLSAKSKSWKKLSADLHINNEFVAYLKGDSQLRLGYARSRRQTA